LSEFAALIMMQQLALTMLADSQAQTESRPTKLHSTLLQDVDEVPEPLTPDKSPFEYAEHFTNSPVYRIKERPFDQIH